jgi:hypothetical protein
VLDFRFQLSLFALLGFRFLVFKAVEKGTDGQETAVDRKKQPDRISRLNDGIIEHPAQQHKQFGLHRIPVK